MRALAWISFLTLLAACEDKPDDRLCSDVREAVERLAGVSNVDCPGTLTKSEAKCIASAGWSNMMKCPGFDKLGVYRSRFSAVHCFEARNADGTGYTKCAIPWHQCNEQRRYHLSISKGANLSECEVSRDPWQLTFACPDGSGTCVEYFANKPDCEKRLPSLKADANNVGQCQPLDSASRL